MCVYDFDKWFDRMKECQNSRSNNNNSIFLPFYKEAAVVMPR